MKQNIITAILITITGFILGIILIGSNELNRVQYTPIPPVQICQTAKCWVEYYSRKEGIDSALPLKIAFCESKFKNVKNPNSSATGIFQFINSTWKENCDGDVWSIRDNSKCGAKLIANGGERHWFQSAKCWSTIDKFNQLDIMIV